MSIRTSAESSPSKQELPTYSEVDYTVATSVGVGVTVYTIADVDPKNECFHCTFRIYLRWFDPHLKLRSESGRRHLEDDEVKSCPKIALNFLESEAVETVMFIESEVQGVIWKEIKYVAKLQQGFDMHDFPYDIQFLGLNILMNHPSDLGRHFKQLPRNPFGLNIKEGYRNTVRSTEWDIHLPRWDIGVLDDKRSFANFRIVLRRRPWYFIHNMVSVSFLVTVLALTAFGSSDFGDRSGILLTLLLTLVAMKYLTSDRLPAISYMTILDVCINSQLAFVALLLVVLAVVARIGEIISSEKLEEIEFAVFIAAAAVLLLIFLLYVFRHIQKNNEARKLLGDPYNDLQRHLSLDL